MSDFHRSLDRALESSRERWLPIPGFDGYDVSSHGRVRSWKRSRKGSGLPYLIRKPYVDSHGYKTVPLGIGVKRQVKRQVHALVALAFLGPRPEHLLVTRHLDGNKLNNHLYNLRYGTDSENRYDAVVHGADFWSSRTHCKNGHEFTPENTRYFPSTGAKRCCVTCARERSRKFYASRAGAAA